MIILRISSTPPKARKAIRLSAGSAPVCLASMRVASQVCPPSNSQRARLLCLPLDAEKFFAVEGALERIVSGLANEWERQAAQLDGAEP